jgi:hypothetical protein
MLGLFVATGGEARDSWQVAFSAINENGAGHLTRADVEDTAAGAARGQ